MNDIMNIKNSYSIILPTLNESGHIRTLILDISNNFVGTNIKYEIIVVDDNSIDGTIEEIKKIKPGSGGEIHITDAIRNLIYNKNKFFANIFKGMYLDCGTLKGYINSGIQINKGIK